MARFIWWHPQMLQSASTDSRSIIISDVCGREWDELDERFQEVNGKDERQNEIRNSQWQLFMPHSQRLSSISLIWSEIWYEMSSFWLSLPIREPRFCNMIIGYRLRWVFAIRLHFCSMPSFRSCLSRFLSHGWEIKEPEKYSETIITFPFVITVVFSHSHRTRCVMLMMMTGFCLMKIVLFPLHSHSICLSGKIGTFFPHSSHCLMWFSFSSSRTDENPFHLNHLPPALLSLSPCRNRLHILAHSRNSCWKTVHVVFLCFLFQIHFFRWNSSFKSSWICFVFKNVWK